MAISQQGAQLRRLIHGFLDDHLKAKLDQIKPDKNGEFTPEQESERQKEIRWRYKMMLFTA